MRGTDPGRRSGLTTVADRGASRGVFELEASMHDCTELRLGFIGSGTITSAIVTGLRTDPVTPCAITLSPRNARVAARLASALPRVRVATSNQQVADESDVVLLAVRPQVAEEVLAGMIFRPEHRVISLIATFSRDRIAALVSPARDVCCAVPLPTVARHLGPTAIFPRDAVAARLFGRLGVAVEVASEVELHALWASTAAMAAYFTLLDAMQSWLTRHGLPGSRARDYVALMFEGLSRVPRESGASFGALAEEFKTKGGLNEQMAAQLTDAGVFGAWSSALDAILARIERGGRSPSPRA
jgi:pyrroline-5-carboxylate reductase